MSEEITEKISSLIIASYYDAHTIKELDKLLDESRNILEPLEHLQQQLKIAVEALEKIAERSKYSTQVDAHIICSNVNTRANYTLAKIEELENE